MFDDPLGVVAKLAVVFESLRVTYAVGGSLASSLHGVPRATNDVDVVADLRVGHLGRFVTALEPNFFVDAEMVRSALADRSSFNIFEQTTMMKVDVFVPGADAWIVEELVRARLETFDVGGQPVAIRFATPEDTLLYKLVWYRLGGEQSDRQWNDVLGILKVQGARLDQAYLRHWAKYLRVSDLLTKAVSD